MHLRQEGNPSFNGEPHQRQSDCAEKNLKLIASRPCAKASVDSPQNRALGMRFDRADLPRRENRMSRREREMSVVSSARGRRSPRRTSHVGVAAWAVYTGGQMLEKGRQNYHFSHFSAPPARLPGAKGRSASRSVRSRSDLSWVLLGAQDPSCV